ncbi:hypothetical protein NLI96_g4310 [Meripilus lineatus]|uniref:Cytochrome P450 n=1 Tax=Meripilus lineatus TaxID=2056292 RepID=A0AAD5V560_9APHY|nr:hypothetical protein NLI96_g4310 [Physisporinus lineatus]
MPILPTSVFRAFPRAFHLASDLVGLCLEKSLKSSTSQPTSYNSVIVKLVALRPIRDALPQDIGDIMAIVPPAQVVTAVVAILVALSVRKLVTGLESVHWLPGNYMNQKHEIISIVPFMLGRPAYHTGSLNVTKQVLEADQLTTEKPHELTAALMLWGENLISSNGETWKRHRRIVGPAFNHNTLPMGWNDSETKSEDEGYSYGEALSGVVETTIPRLHVIETTWKTMAKAMDELIISRKEEVSTAAIEGKPLGADIFTRLVSEYDDDAKHGLDKQEVIGNTFAMLFAGHETTARVLGATFGFLAIYPEEQEKALQEIRSLLGDREPTLDDLSNLPHTQGCFYEALRFYPAGVLVTRDILEDITIHVERPEPKTICLEKGSRVIIDMVGVHYDPYVFPNPDAFVPSRWDGVPEHAVSMFGLGPRACIGRRFSITEAVCFLAMFLRDFKVDVVLEPGETREQYRERVMSNAGMIGLAFGVRTIPLKISRRV